MRVSVRPKAPLTNASTAQSRSYTDDEVREAFQSFDIDKNMYIGVSELKHVLNMIGEKVSDEEVDAILVEETVTVGFARTTVDGSSPIYNGIY